ncbi:dihydrodipicolinate synthase family protein [Gibbsiella quercinecans]|uniref:dihydrodipicolinate synthase family protein n=1 Tax=Gibbsiella quercinecans TaxID=929813 RepID=UPI000EF1579C|nr:dihydrodipicolinate synthase family protein [Gibbsiella quercinecans]RLM07748.1 dihydrodipicolinate synthase family protein [Gibbsiella quercinecans]
MQKLTEQAKGVYIISATPFTDSGELDLASADTLTDFYLEKGVDGITILGILGEAHKLTEEETEQFMQRVLTRVNGRVPVIVGVSHPSHRHVERLAKKAMACGAAGVMLAPAPNLKTDPQVENYFLTIGELLGPDIPLCLQDYPQSTGVYTSVPVMLRLIEALPQLVMLKHEELSGMGKLSQLRRQSAERGLRRISILVGNGGLFLPQELARGADGAMTGFAWPEMLVQVCRAYAEGDATRGEDIFDRYLPLLRHEFQYGIGLALRKETLRRRGAIQHARVRPAGPALDQNDLDELTGLIDRLKQKLQQGGMQ